MEFDPNNPVIKQCVLGMEMEGKGEPERALQCYRQAWDEANTDFEKFTAAHYLARQQETTGSKLKWDETALDFALRVKNPSVMSSWPSLYLNIAKCHEDLKNREKALENYERARTYCIYLPDDGYGKLIRQGVLNGIKRMEQWNG